MDLDLSAAKAILNTSEYNLVLLHDDDLITSDEKGIAPLMAILSTGQDMSSFVAADNVIGKAAAFIYVKLGIKKIYAKLISELALNVFEAHEIECSYKEKVPMIMNQKKNGNCPMESAVKDIEDVDQAIEILKGLSKK